MENHAYGSRSKALKVKTNKKMKKSGKKNNKENYISFKLVDDLQSEGINCTIVHQRLQHIFGSNHRRRCHSLPRNQQNLTSEFVNEK